MPNVAFIKNGTNYSTVSTHNVTNRNSSSNMIINAVHSLCNFIYYRYVNMYHEYHMTNEYTRWFKCCFTTVLFQCMPLTVWVCIPSNFSVGRRKTIFSAKVRFGRSRSSKVIGTSRKRVCDFLLVRDSNLGPVLHRFRDIAGF